MGKHILLAEHNQTLATSLIRLLRSRKFEASYRSDGVSALRSIAAAPPDLLLLDLELPDIDGLELLRKLRRSPHTSSLEVIILSGAHKRSSITRRPAPWGWNIISRNRLKPAPS